MSVTIPILGKDQIVIGYDIRERIVGDTLRLLPSSTYVVVSDTNIAQHAHFRALLDDFAAAIKPEQRLLEFLVAPGELTKTRATKATVEDFMFAHACTRDTVVLAVGGGVIGDMIGYVAATFMRGVRYVQIPTTLLAMVDSSIGGKTAVDVPAGKNLVGAFWQPSLNFLELRFLETLPRREFLNGMAEVIKTAAIWNAAEFDRLEAVNPTFMAALDAPRDARGRVDLAPIRQILLDLVQGSVRVKAEVVTLDEREGGLRNILNWGHSIGHAIEALLTPHVLHGECVAIGSVLEAELARYLGHLSPAAVARIAACFKAYELPVSVNDAVVRRRSRNAALPVPRLLEIMAVDKKNAGATKKVVLLSRIGQTWEPKASAVSDADLKVVLSSEVAVCTLPKAAPAVEIVPPGSKSISNRVLVLCALAEGTCRVRNLLHSDDTAVMLDALQILRAATVELADNGDTLVVTGSGGRGLATPANELYLGNAGTAARILTAVAALVPGTVRLTGNARMQERPIGALVDALRANGQTVDYVKREGSLPVDVHTPEGHLAGGRIELAATVSSQYVSALLLVAPYAQKPVTLSLVGGKPISQFYIDMTVQMMADFGVTVTKSTTEAHTYHIPQATYRAPETYTVESDASSATYPLAFAALTGTACTVPTIGSASLQGDARFAVDVLRPMGCAVEQTATSTTVRGPAGPLKAIEVDMEPMTDAFLTACVVAAVAEGTTRISGIANQHVKECDRINAMHDQLAAFGVETVEGADGIDVVGVGSKSGLRVPERTLHSYDDHRVAMSLSLLATQVGGATVIDERRCVEKTWPGWWDTLHTKLGVKLEGRSPPPAPEATVAAGAGSGGDARTIVLVGMRGAGKTTLGEATAAVLGLAFVDLDRELERKVGPLADLIAKEGWPAFREQEADLLAAFLASHPRGFVVACGGGIVELERARSTLEAHKASGFVVHVHRSYADIAALLGADTTRPPFAEPLDVVYARREPLYRQVSNRLFFAPTVEQPASLRGALAAFFAPPEPLAERSFFLSLTYPDLTKADLGGLTLPALLEGCAAVELRVDLLKQWDREFVGQQVAFLRLHSALPIIFTVRSLSQGGRFPDADADGYADLVRFAYDLAVEYVDIELTQKAVHPWVMAQRTKPAFGARTRVIASHHDPAAQWAWSGVEWHAAFFDANRLGDIVKFVSMATSFADNFALEAFRESVAASHAPFIGINMGVHGRLSRVLNRVLTPVTHPALPVAAAPGQLSVAEANSMAADMGLLRAQQFFVAGEPIGHSQSPALHNAAFAALGLPHSYKKLPTSEAASVAHRIAGLGAAFGGASITIPLKRDVVALCHTLGPEAEAIGAVNTLTPIDVVSGEVRLRGDNTDWRGVRDAFRCAGVLTGRNAVVLGAGGTAAAAVYAFARMGFRTAFVLNRTAERIAPLVERFAGLIRVVAVTPENVGDVVDVAAVMSTVPGDSAIPQAVLGMLEQLLEANRGVLLEAAYKPAETPVMQLAERLGWETVPGRELLVLQGVAQARIWTGFYPLETAEEAVE